jgi:hypothetical protein
MVPTDIQREVLNTLTGLKEEMGNMKEDLHYIKEYLEDSRLSAEEKKILDESIAKIKRGDKSGFVSHEQLKKELGI